MKERPIAFSGPMVLALFAGTKTQTRRIIKPIPEIKCFGDGPQAWQPVGGVHSQNWICPYGKPVDRLWVREDHMVIGDNSVAPSLTVAYCADGGAKLCAVTPREFALYRARKSKPGSVVRGRFSYRSIARIVLEVVSVRAERLNAISEADAVAEGVTAYRSPDLLTVVDSAGNTCEITPDYIYGVPKAGDAWMGRTVTHVEPRPGALLDTARDSYRKLWEKINGPGSWEANPWVWVVSFRRVEP